MEAYLLVNSLVHTATIYVPPSARYRHSIGGKSGRALAVCPRPVYKCGTLSWGRWAGSNVVRQVQYSTHKIPPGMASLLGLNRCRAAVRRDPRTHPLLQASPQLVAFAVGEPRHLALKEAGRPIGPTRVELEMARTACDNAPLAVSSDWMLSRRPLLSWPRLVCRDCREDPTLIIDCAQHDRSIVYKGDVDEDYCAERVGRVPG